MDAIVQLKTGEFLPQLQGRGPPYHINLTDRFWMGFGPVGVGHSPVQSVTFIESDTGLLSSNSNFTSNHFSSPHKSCQAPPTSLYSYQVIVCFNLKQQKSYQLPWTCYASKAKKEHSSCDSSSSLAQSLTSNMFSLRKLNVLTFRYQISQTAPT